ncbi:uncharacterized protein LOC118507355 [Anopheles stephensi]|uniref:uncharacterized protein LOC118507355 n=1 Tax=Anopheles stephensi TaxID=30069 RepID=UPI001658C240|nr:uncharacterized protein LOC118507355 [Anopheles stephensi]
MASSTDVQMPQTNPKWVKSLTISIKYDSIESSLKVDERSMIRDYEELRWFIIKNRSYDHVVQYSVYYDDETGMRIQITTERGYRTFMREHANKHARIVVLVERVRRNEPHTESVGGIIQTVFGAFYPIIRAITG